MKTIVLIRALTIVALIWAVAVTIRMMTSPAAMTMTATVPGDPAAEPVAIGWFEYAGFYGTVLLLLWTGLFGLGMWAAWIGKTAVLAFIAIGTFIFSWLTLLSFGGGYLPASFLLVVALILSVVQKRRSP